MELYLIKNPISKEFWLCEIYRSLARRSRTYNDSIYIFKAFDYDDSGGDYWEERGLRLRCRQDLSLT